MSKAPPLTDDEVDHLIKITCPHCLAGVVVRKRDSTGEWVHDFAQPLGTGREGTRNSHTLCLATGIRNEYGKA
jgi:hypothetical protein